ncbi:ArsC/Spx/MgsR family protein [Maricaulis sp.]|uniref:ArsC/Spx/MgsR family protein n=1 Tax=Maricaulis sp. TaxID=1486257 RepID=UPI0026159000|nr:ArsC/Spx/MgsR family protein [Maricaulis sp.]
MTKLFGLKNCDGCKKAMKALDAAGIAYDFVDIRAEADLPARLPLWLDKAGAKALVNTRSTTWRGLDEVQRARAESDPAGLLAENPTLIKRPVVETGEQVFAGWSDKVLAACQP